MSTLATADLGASSDEEDGDFIPTASKAQSRRKPTKRPRSDSNSSSPSSSSSSHVRSGEEKRVKLDAGTGGADESRRKAAETFSALRAEASFSGPAEVGGEGTRLVEVVRARRFAGEMI